MLADCLLTYLLCDWRAAELTAVNCSWSGGRNAIRRSWNAAGGGSLVHGSGTGDPRHFDAGINERSGRREVSGHWTIDPR